MTLERGEGGGKGVAGGGGNVTGPAILASCLPTLLQHNPLIYNKRYSDGNIVEKIYIYYSNSNMNYCKYSNNCCLFGMYSSAKK